jgi:hypothetical protein
MWKLQAEINFLPYLKFDFHRAGVYWTHARLIPILTCRTQNSIKIGNFITWLTKIRSYAFHYTIFMEVTNIK